MIAESTLKKYWQSPKYKRAAKELKAWIINTYNENWNNTQDVKKKYGNASIIDNKRVVFDISGNHFRLVVDIEYRFKTIYIVWFGTHQEYDNINIKTIAYKPIKKYNHD
ncbi:MAG: type II toxin-antitoxin system HigB family toxin [Cytophagales bacterium]|nr:type II toxin-antitoxin system HigB family toxin [Cytophagales bacterium]